MKIRKCRCCNGENVEQFFDLGNQPFANALLTDISEFETEKKYPLSLSICKDCSLVQLDYTADPEELFSNYFWVTGTSETARSYSEEFCNRAVGKITELKSSYILELASNDGTFLKAFKKRGYEVLGVDPAKNIAQMASESGIPTKADFFGIEVAKKIIQNKGYPEIVYARNVVPHVANLHDFVEGIAYCCNEENFAIVEVHYAGIILEELHYDSIYHEHLCYFTLKSLTELFAKHGLTAFDIDFSPISGGSIVVYMSKNVRTRSEKLEIFEKEEYEKGYNRLDKWKEFAEKAYDQKRQLLESINTAKDDGKIVAYGASARSSTLLNFCGITNLDIAFVIDQNVMKQGKFTPGSHMEIVSPECGMDKNPNKILLLAWNFKDEVMSYLKDGLNYTGEVIVPLPYSVKEEHIEKI